MKKIKPFDTQKKPHIPYFFLMPIEWIGTLYYTVVSGIKIRKHNMKGLKPPYLILSNHASFVDFPIAVKACFPFHTNWVISIEEFIGREWLMRGVGGIYKRKFTADITVVKHILTVLKKRKDICTMYPEARFSLAGINEPLDGALGKLVKMAECPVVVIIEHGNFLQSPQWCKHPLRKVKISSDATQIVTVEEAKTLSADEIQKKIENAFLYDDYKWQFDNSIKIKSKARAKNLHKILYQCPVCEKEFFTHSDGTSLWCENCGSKWEMDFLGRLHCTTGEESFTHVPDWYRWERQNVKNEIRSGNYHFSDTVRIEKLVNCRKGFNPIGFIKFTHDYNGFTLSGKLESGDYFSLERPVSTMYSCHIEYNFKGRGDAIDIATLKDTYFVFPQNAYNVLTKIHFAAEELFIYENEKKISERLSMKGKALSEN